MCRLFGLTGGREPVRATFWLLEAPDSLAQQSRGNPDGTGIGYYDADRNPVVLKQPLAAYEDQQFAREAREIAARTFVAHVRHASGSPVTLRNTHPFVQAGRLFAHNGVIEDVPRLEAHLGDGMSMVGGETDSERYFALITKEIEQTGDVARGIVAAASWIAENLPVFALNCVLITAGELWALRYPDTHALNVLERGAGGTCGKRHLDLASARGSVRVRSAELSHRPAVIVASEEMDEDPGWRPLQSGELVHVDAELRTTVHRVIEGPPADQLTLADLDPQAAASQAPAQQA
jgi:predicted glutamine amidotransferase